MAPPAATRIPRRAADAPEHHVLSGWGESVRGWARVHRPRTAEDVARLLARCAGERRPVTLRAAGRSYGDAALHASGDVLDVTELSRIRSFDAATGVVEAEGGVPIETLWREFLPRGFWPEVVPGTMRPTVAGCVAMNVHGKNHFKVGGFAAHVEELELATTTGELRRVRAADEPELFRAVAGGMGLLGAVTAARVRLHRVHSGRMRVTALPTRSLAETIDAFDRRAAESDYLVGWVDCFDPDGRGVVHAAKHLAPGEDPEAEASLAVARQELPPRIAGVVPRAAAASLLRPAANPAGMRAINEAKYRLAALRGEHVFLQEHVRFAFLLDYVPGWKRIYEPGGLLQHQSFVPRERALATHLALLRLCRERGIVPWLGVYKRHRACDTLLPHAMDGTSFALDFPVPAGDRSALVALCRAMDEVVLAAGGRCYFAKDQTASPEFVRAAYPGLDAFREIKRRLDPAGVLTSDLARRVGIVA